MRGAGRPGEEVAVTTMRRVVAYPGQIAVEEAEIPAPGPNEALVRMLAAGVCGSDLHAAHGRHPFVPLPYRRAVPSRGDRASSGVSRAAFGDGGSGTAAHTAPEMTSDIISGI